MRLRGAIYFLAASLTVQPALAQSTFNRCDLSDIQNIRDLQTALQREAIEAVNLAASGEKETRLRQLIDSSATLSSGGGDVGVPLGNGIAGIRALAKHMKADKYRTFDWTGIPFPISNGCGPQETNVEFINTGARESFEVKFKFKAGRIVSAETWSRSFSTGSLYPLRK